MRQQVCLSLSFLLCVITVNAERCSPGLVPNVTLNPNYNLNWSRPLNPNNCTIIAYVINLIDPEDNSQLQFETRPSSLGYNFNFLEMCKTYIFEVHALTDSNFLGPANSVNGTTAPLPSMNLSLALRYNVVANRLNMSWNTVSSAASKCVSYYRIIYWDESNWPSDIYVHGNNFSVANLIPCMRYKIQVNAIVNNPDITGPTSEIAFNGSSTVPSTPKLVNLTTTKSGVNMTWKVPAYNESHCELTSLVVVTTGTSYKQNVLNIPIRDSRLRPNINVTIDGLSANHAYLSYVALKNVAGSSKNVTVSYQTPDTFFFSDIN